MKKEVRQFGQIYTLEEIADILRVDQKPVYRLVGKRELVAFLVGRVLRVMEKDFLAYIKAMKEKVKRSPKRSY